MNNVQEVSSIVDGLSERFVKYQVRVQVLPHEWGTIYEQLKSAKCHQNNTVE
jgi:hypothetical protein